MQGGYVNPSSEAYTPYSASGDMGLPMVAQMGLDAMAASLGSAYGALPFRGHNSYVGIKRDQAFTQAHQIAMNTAGAADRQGWIELQRGAAAMTNTKWTPDLQREAEKFADFVTSKYGIASNSPAAMHAIDTLMGGTSALPLAHYMHTAGRHQYDPATGMSHMSGQSAAQMAAGLHSQFFGDMTLPDGTVVSGRDSWRSRTKGLTAMDLGQLYGHLSSRGMMPGAHDYSGVYDLDTMDGQQNAVADHTKRIGDTMKDRAGALAAMKELFDDPNAPIPQMLDAMEALTGGTQQLTPQRAEMLVRNLKEAAKGAQVTVEGLLMVSQQSEQMASTLGLNRAFGGQMAATGLNTMEALQRTGAMGHGYWGQSDIDTIRAKEQARLGRGFASDFANSAGALGNLLDALPNDGRSASARQLYEDMRAGRTDTDLFRRFSVMEREEQINWIAQNTGLAASEVAAQFDAVTGNQERVYKDALGGSILDAQRTEFGRKVLGRSFAAQTNGLLTRMGENSEGLNALLTQTSIETLMNMDQETRASSSARFGTMSMAMLEKLEQAAAGGDTQAQALLAKLNKEQGGAQGALYRMAQIQYGNADTEMQGGLADYLTAMSPEVEAERKQAKARTQAAALDGYSMAGMVEGSWSRRLMGAIREAGAEGAGGADMAKIIARTLNIENPSEQVEKLAGQLGTYEKAAMDLAKAREKDLAPIPGESKEAYQQRLASHKRELGRYQSVYDERAKEMRAIIDSDPKLKAEYEKYQDSLKPGGAAESEAKIENANLTANQLTFKVDTLHINGQVVKDATGTGKTKPGGRGQGTV